MGPTLRLCHVALRVADPEISMAFYVDILGMKVVWRPDADNIYLSNGSDNLALHRSILRPGGSLDHIGFTVSTPGDVDVWHDRLQAAGVIITAPPRTHRDDSRSLYCQDPDQNLVQILFIPSLH